MNKILLACLLTIFSINSFAKQDEAVRVLLHTSMGDITLELNEKAAPKTVANFLQYIDQGFYNNTVFHRVISDFMIQGGGFEKNMIEKTTRAPIINESANGLLNLTGTIAMARRQDPDSATAQFFINLTDNAFLNASPGKPGYTVFGKVVIGMDVVERIAKTSTSVRGIFQDVPLQDIVILNTKRLP